MKNYIKLMRPKHYIKNFLIFFPLVFSGNFFDRKVLFSTILAFFAFSLAASVVYIVNDIKDKEKDKLHEKKKHRPIASGKVSVKNAIILAIALFVASFGLQFLATFNAAHISYIYILVYVVINLAYSFGLKNVPLLDVAILASGFLIRVLYGASVTGIAVSNWLYLTIISAAFYLGLGKRRNEIKKVGKDSRKVLQYYNEEFLDKNMYMCLSLAIVFYALWTVDPIVVLQTGNLLVWTVPIVILILMKYSMNVENDSLGDPVDVVLADPWLLGIILVYGMTVMGIVYCL